MPGGPFVARTSASIGEPYELWATTIPPRPPQGMTLYERAGSVRHGCVFRRLENGGVKGAEVSYRCAMYISVGLTWVQ